MKTRSQEVCKILNRHRYLGYTDWRVHENDHAQIYVICGHNPIEEVKTMYEAFEIAATLEIESGVKFGGEI